MMPAFVLVWNSGHAPPRPVFYHQTPAAWDATYDRSQAHRFPTAESALEQWRRLHAWPEDYEHCITEGTTRAELCEPLQLALTLS